MGSRFFILCACIVFLVVNIAQVEAQRRVFNVKKFGAIADGRTENSRAFIAAWNRACLNHGGGIIVFPKGSYVVAPVVLKGPCKGPVELKIQGALLASKQPGDFVNVDHWITIQYVTGLVIGGAGSFDGLGPDGWKYNDCQRNPGHCKQLPATLRLDFVYNAVVYGLTFIDSKNTHINLFACRNLLIRNIRIIAPADSPNTDGIHIGGSQYINVLDSQISTGDDCISILPGSQFINATGVQCGPGHGISIGSLGKGKGDSVSDVYVKNSRFVDTDNGVRIKTWAVNSQPGSVSRVAFENVRMNNVDNPIIIDQEYCPGGGCSQHESSKVRISYVKFIDIRGTSSTKDAVTLKCSQSTPCQNVELRDIDLTYRGPGGPAVSVCENVLGRAYGTQNPTLRLDAPHYANPSGEIPDANGEDRPYGLYQTSNLKTEQAAPFEEAEDDSVQQFPEWMN